MFGVGPFEMLMFVVVLVLVVLPFWKIFSKAGYSGALSLLMIVPIIGVIVLFYLAFAEWPVHRDLQRLKQE